MTNVSTSSYKDGDFSFGRDLLFREQLLQRALQLFQNTMWQDISLFRVQSFIHQPVDTEKDPLLSTETKIFILPIF